MYLVDTSVWIDFLREKTNSAVLFFQKILEQNIPYGITPMIYQEILQGAKNESDFKKLNEYLSTQRFFYPLNGLQSYNKAASIYFECRKKGITIRSTIDCLIAQIAIENKLILLHNDLNYIQIKKIYTLLKLES